MLDLPDPVLDDDCKPRSVFKKFFAITNFDVRIQKLIVAYIMAAFYKEGTKPVLLLEGPHGCAKTSGLEIVTGTLDPHGAQLPSLHRSEENLFIYARNRVFAGFDNVSDFKPNISDALCQIATGGSITKRRNYSDDDEFVIPARALLALNGISTGLKRPDLLDRTIKIELQPLPEGERTSMQKIKQRFIEIHPRVLGWLLRATQYGLQNPTPLPAGMQTGRLVDFAQWTYQWAPALGLNPDKLVAAIYENQRGAQAEAIHADTCADFIFYLLDQNDDFWRGTPTALFEELNEWIDDRLGGRRRKGQFPTAPNTLHDWLKRSAPLLETAGVSYDKSRVNNQRLITIVRTSSAEQH